MPHLKWQEWRLAEHSGGANCRWICIEHATGEAICGSAAWPIGVCCRRAMSLKGRTVHRTPKVKWVTSPGCIKAQYVVCHQWCTVQSKSRSSSNLAHVECCFRFLQAICTSDEQVLTVASTEATSTASFSSGEVNTPQLLLLVTVGRATTENLPLPVKAAVAR